MIFLCTNNFFAIVIAVYFSTISVILVLSETDQCSQATTAKLCDKKYFGEDSFVCVCGDKTCDVAPNIRILQKGRFTRIVSTRDEHRFFVHEDNHFSDTPTGEIMYKISYQDERQEIFGFGGAFSDATGISIKSLPDNAQDNLVRSYFSEDGIGYTLCRIPIGGSDFSTRPYTYDDDHENDVELKHFKLAEEDFKYKIPLIKQARKLSKKELKLFGSIWAPPAWMKENKKLNGKGGLLREMWDPYSNYLLRFVKEYEKQEIPIWGITTVNEPLAGFQDWPWNACAWSAEVMRDWLKASLGPLLEKSNYLDRLKIMIFEHGIGKSIISDYPVKILKDGEARKYVDGVAIHWYGLGNESVIGGEENSAELHSMFPDKFILHTEACLGFDQPEDRKVLLGSWERAEIYAESIIENLNNYVAGWIDWNMALNMQGGPNWVGNYVDAPIIVDKKNERFYKQPMFYAMGHFSKYVLPGSKALLIKNEKTNLQKENLSKPQSDLSELQKVMSERNEYLSEAKKDLSDQPNDNLIKISAFVNKQDETVAVVILNKADEKKEISLNTKSGKWINVLLNRKSIETVIFALFE